MDKRTDRRPRKRTDAVLTPEEVRNLGVVDQVTIAFQRRNILPTALGFVLGGVIPVTTFVVSHYGMPAGVDIFDMGSFHVQLLWIPGGLAFSAKTVFEWTKLAFRGDRLKAVGFVLLSEGVMTTMHIMVLCYVLLAVLVGINGVATGCTLSLNRRAR